ncbi:MAG: alcohol dehydrogenase catalytic domain-containing protein [Microthrixaceae bacterium]
MKALVVDRRPIRFGAAMATSRIRPGSGAAVGVITLDDIDPPDLPSPDWVRLSPRMSGICGSDLATVDGRSSRWFEPIVSFPFVPGHEVVADDPEGRRVILEPVLGCVARGIDPPCPPCANGNAGNCERLAHGHVDAGLQTGFCCDTGGGWSTEMVAHPSQLHEVPDDMSDTAAVMVEPTACAIHAVLRAQIQPDERVAVIGAGTLGLLSLAATRPFLPRQRTVHRRPLRTTTPAGHGASRPAAIRWASSTPNAWPGESVRPPAQPSSNPIISIRVDGAPAAGLAVAPMSHSTVLEVPRASPRRCRSHGHAVGSSSLACPASRRST